MLGSPAMMRMSGWLVGLMVGATVIVSGCAPKTGVRTANVQAGSMPAGQTFKGVWYSEAFGELHLVPEGTTVVGKWKDKSHGKWGKLTGSVNGDLIKFHWVEHKIGSIGPGSTAEGHGYFKYIPSNDEMPLPKLKGEWGFKDNEVGGGTWDMNRVQDREPNLAEVGSDEDPTVDSGWDQDPNKKK